MKTRARSASATSTTTTPRRSESAPSSRAQSLRAQAPISGGSEHVESSTPLGLFYYAVRFIRRLHPPERSVLLSRQERERQLRRGCRTDLLHYERAVQRADGGMRR